MKRQLIILLISTVMLYGSCTVIGSLYPVSDNEKDLIFKKELIGKWGNKEKSPEYYIIDTFSGQNGKLYKIKTFIKKGDNNDTLRLNATLVLVSGWYFLDCQIDLENEFKNPDKDLGELLISRHYIFRLEFRGTDQFEIVAPDAEELIKLIDQKKINANYAQLKKDDYLILDRPAILQKAITESKKYPLLYENKNTFYRLE
jgi:hypothetical protein